MSNKTGFTLIELMLAVVISVIVIMATGVTLGSMARQQSRYQTHTTLQADLYLIDHTIRAKVRECYYANMTIPAANKVEIVVDGKTSSFRTELRETTGGKSYYNLIYNNGSADVVLSDAVTSFVCSEVFRDDGKSLHVEYAVYYPDYNFSAFRELDCMPRFSYAGDAVNAITDDPQTLWDNSFK